MGGHTNAPTIYTRFFKKVGNAMQLSEGAGTGETGNDSDGDGIPFIPEQPDNLPPVFASEATLSFSPTGIGGRDNRIASQFAIEQNYPNPFKPTTISYRIPREGEVTITIYNVTDSEWQRPAGSTAWPVNTAFRLMRPTGPPVSITTK